MKEIKTTINCNPKIAAAIEAIGEFSPEAKRQILAGEININKNALVHILSMPPEEIEEIAREIEEGVYERKHSGEKEFSNGGIFPEVDSYYDTLLQFKTEVAKITQITEDLVAEFWKRENSGESPELKTALREYIDMLEELYGQI